MYSKNEVPEYNGTPEAKYFFSSQVKKNGVEKSILFDIRTKAQTWVFWTFLDQPCGTGLLQAVMASPKKKCFAVRCSLAFLDWHT